jgi:DNA-binding transcriptional ArsR family regulator
VLIAEKLGVSQPTASEHMKILLRAGLVRAKRIKQWTFYKRDEPGIKKLKKMIVRGSSGESTSVPEKSASAGVASTGENEPCELSTDH